MWDNLVKTYWSVNNKKSAMSSTYHSGSAINLRVTSWGKFGGSLEEDYPEQSTSEYLAKPRRLMYKNVSSFSKRFIDPTSVYNLPWIATFTKLLKPLILSLWVIFTSYSTCYLTYYLFLMIVWITFNITEYANSKKFFIDMLQTICKNIKTDKGI